MGLFSDSTETTVGTTISRVIEDDALPNSIKTGVLKAIFQNGDISPYLVEEMIGSIGAKADRMYDYGRDHYAHGLPVGFAQNSNQGLDETQAVIEAFEGAAIDIEYYRFEQRNLLHIGWIKLLADYGYDMATNELPVLSAILGKPVFLWDMVPAVPFDMAHLVGKPMLERWGSTPKYGAAPGRTTTPSLDTVLALHSPIVVDITGAVTVPSVLVTTAAEVGGFVLGGVALTQFVIPITGYLEDKEHFQVKYKVGGVTKYWIYQDDAGTYPTLDALHKVETTQLGEYFPFAYFRYNKVSEITDKTTDAYKTSKKLLKYLGINYDQVGEAIDDNPDIDDIEQAMIAMVVPAATEIPIEQQYLFDYFDKLYVAVGNHDTSPLMDVIWKGFSVVALKIAVLIQDSRFKMALSYEGIFKRRYAGNIGPVGSHTSGVRSEVMDVATVSDYTTGTMTDQSKTLTYHWYRHQVSATVYDEIQVLGLSTMYYIDGDYKTIGNIDNPQILLIPIDRTISDLYSLPEKELLYSRALHYVFNSLIETTVHWYQSGFFQFLMIVVTLVVTVASLGSSWQAMAAAISTGAMSIEAALLAIAIGVIKYVASTLVIKLFVKAMGMEAAFLIAILAAVAGFAMSAFNAGGLAGAPWAQNLLRVATGLAKGVGNELKAMMTGLVDDAKQFADKASDQLKLLETSKELLEGQNILSPFTIFGESPDEYFNRTIHSGNIGVLGISAISSYVDIALTLPKLDSAVGGNSYV